MASTLPVILNVMSGTIFVKLKQIFISLFKLLLAISTILLVAIFILTGGHFFKKSGLSNCVIVADENDFSGEWLKHSKSEVFTRLPTIDCIEKDRHIDSSDGPKKGIVRWAECLYGPDCDEAGMN